MTEAVDGSGGYQGILGAQAELREIWQTGVIWEVLQGQAGWGHGFKGPGDCAAGACGMRQTWGNWGKAMLQWVE